MKHRVCLSWIVSCISWFPGYPTLPPGSAQVQRSRLSVTRAACLTMSIPPCCHCLHQNQTPRTIAGDALMAFCLQPADTENKPEMVYTLFFEGMFMHVFIYTAFWMCLYYGIKRINTTYNTNTNKNISKLNSIQCHASYFKISFSTICQEEF